MSKDLTNKQDFSFVLSTIKQAQQKVYKQVNKALLELYWQVGKYVSDKVSSEQWGKSVIEDMSKYILENEPNIKGFSARNIWTMKQFYEMYAYLGEKLPTLLAEIGWSHNRRIMSLKTPEEREFYLKLCAENNYSFRELERLINTGTFERTMLANKKMPEIVKQLPQNVENIFKDSYIFDFLDLPVPHSEKDLQTALASSLKDFILELGKGFSFIGQEYRVQVGNDDFYIDLLFFHRQLQCLVALELKTEKFKPEHLGQLEFYLEALDRDVKLPNENPSIGILLCREKNNEVVEYALSRALSPALISDYETKLIPKELLRKKLNEFYQILESKNDKNEQF
ncbi:MAG: PDDEXK nuclease domain-containing protein [Candidatus Marinimicrobia bacterium]|nr:PDDEXK nuclease domain-containing protein [Candidatus Neomarinimicrobiota bacterium]